MRTCCDDGPGARDGPAYPLACMSLSAPEGMRFSDASGKSWHSPWDALVSRYNSATGGDGGAGEFARRVAAACPKGCGESPEQVEECFALLCEALEKFDPSRAASPAPLALRILEDAGTGGRPAGETGKEIMNEQEYLADPTAGIDGSGREAAYRYVPGRFCPRCGSALEYIVVEDRRGNHYRTVHRVRTRERRRRGRRASGAHPQSVRVRRTKLSATSTSTSTATAAAAAAC